MDIRAAKTSDASRLAEILVYAKRLAYRTIFNDDIESFVKMQVLPIAQYFQNENSEIQGILVYDDAIVKGLLSRGISRDKDLNDAYEMYALYVDPFFQHKGIGSRLVEAFILEAKQKRFPYISLWVLKDNEKAIRFYRLKGFQEDGSIRKAGKSEIDEIRMVQAVSF